MNDRPRLTIEAARALKSGETLYDHDPKTRGLELRARGTKKTWHLYYRFNGKQRRPKLAEFPGVSIDGAREIAKAWKIRIAKGEDPSDARQTARGAPLVRDLIKHYLENYAETEYRPETLSTVKGIMSRFVGPVLGAKRVDEITVADVNGLIVRIAEGRVKIPTGRTLDDGTAEMIFCAKSPTSANATRRFMSKMFALAEGDSLRWRPRSTNPCQDEETKSYQERKRRVHLETHEFAEINNALMALAPEFPWHVACLYVIMFAGSRLTEIATARRSWIVEDRMTGEHYLMLGEHKTADHIGEKDVFLPRAAMAIIERLPQKGPFIFGPLAKLRAPRRTLWRVWDMARVRAGIRPEVQPRDLRRTFASIARTNKAQLEDIAALLAHANTATTERYAYLFEDKRQDLANATANTMKNLLEAPSPTDKPRET